MKKIASIILAIALAAGLSGCSGPAENDIDPSGNTESLVSTNDGAVSAVNSESSDTVSVVVSDTASDTSAASQPESGFTAPDGTTVSFSEGLKVYDEGSFQIYDFEFCWLRSLEPVFRSTLDEPDLVADWDNFEFKEGVTTEVEDPKWFRVKAGDVLENGLVVKGAKCTVDSNGMLMNPKVQCEGELTLEGFLYLQGEDEYGVSAGDLLFYADPRQTKLPKIAAWYGAALSRVFGFGESKFALLYDGIEFKVGNLNDIDMDLSGIAYAGEFVKARVDVKDPVFGNYEGPGYVSNAVLVSAESIN